jgi:hypothetical protein
MAIPGGQDLHQNGGSGASYRIRMHAFCGGFTPAYAPESVWSRPYCHGYAGTAPVRGI